MRTPADYIQFMLDQIPVLVQDGLVLAFDTSRVTGITIVENLNEPSHYIICCGPNEHYHTTDHEAVRKICERVRFRMISKTVVTAREA